MKKNGSHKYLVFKFYSSSHVWQIWPKICILEYYSYLKLITGSKPLSNKRELEIFIRQEFLFGPYSPATTPFRTRKLYENTFQVMQILTRDHYLIDSLRNHTMNFKGLYIRPLWTNFDFFFVKLQRIFARFNWKKMAVINI